MSGIINSVGSKSGVIGLFGQNRPRFSVKNFDHAGSGSVITYQSNTDVFYNIGGGLNLANGRFTPPVNGLYLLIFGVISNAASTRTEFGMRLIRNASTTDIGSGDANPGTGNYGHAAAIAQRDLLTTDYVHVKQHSGTILSNHPGCWYHGYLLQ